MQLHEYITLLKKYDPTRRIPLGLGNPHSWRGSYDELAFEPVENTTIGEMLSAAEEALDTNQTGYKGGEFCMTGDTTINIDYEGEWTDGNQELIILFTLMLGEPR